MLDPLLHVHSAAKTPAHMLSIIHMLLLLFVGVVSLFASACDTSPQPLAAHSSATATPSLAHVDHVSLGNFQASSLLPMAHGLLVFGTPGPIGRPGDTPPDQNGKPRALYYYVLATRTIERLVTISDTSGESITSVAAAGDWVVYTTGIGPTNFEDVEQTWALNVATHEQQAVTRASGLNDLGSIATDGQVVVWTSYQEDNLSAHYDLRRYDLRSHRVQTLATFSVPSDPDFLDVYVLATDQGTILYSESYRVYGAPTDDARNGLYLWTPTVGGPQRIGSEWSADVHLSTRYFVWDDSRTQSVTLYDRHTGTATIAWATSCIRPDLTANGGYVACLDYVRRFAVVIRVDTLARTVLGDTVDDANGAIVEGRVFWIVRTGVTEFGNTLGEWELPRV